MEVKIIIPIISALISVFVSAIVSFYVSNQKYLRDEEARLNQQILELNKIIISYPYLEDDEFCKNWNDNKNKNDERYQRYDSYCCIVFNLMEQIHKYYRGDKEKINKFFATKEMILRHINWWKKPSGIFENINGYSNEFQQYIRSFSDKPEHS